MAEDNNCRHTVMDRINETTWECPKCGAISILRKNISKVQKFSISGIEIRPGLEVRRLSRSSAYVGVPKRWMGKEVVVILVDSSSSPEVEPRLTEGEIKDGIKSYLEIIHHAEVAEISKTLGVPLRITRKICTVLKRENFLSRSGNTCELIQ